VRSNASEAVAVLLAGGAEVTVTEPGVLAVGGLPAEAVVAALTERHVAFSEVAAHRATLEQAYLELTRDDVDYRAGEPAR
jgi:ABC-2 type transport system ATP-binding protein